MVLRAQIPIQNMTPKSPKYGLLLKLARDGMIAKRGFGRRGEAAKDGMTPGLGGVESLPTQSLRPDPKELYTSPKWENAYLDRSAFVATYKR